MTMLDAARFGDSAESEMAENLASIWPDFVNCRMRLHTLAPFLGETVGLGAGDTVLDAAAGSGCEAELLANWGACVTANEISEPLRAQLRQRAEGVGFEITAHDWRSLAEVLSPVRFDAVLLLGNSLALLLDPADRREAVRNLAALCKPGGKLVIDQRDFGTIWSRRTALLSGEAVFGRRIMYCGTKVVARPLSIDEAIIRMGYYDQPTGHLAGFLEMSMLPENWLLHCLEAVADNIECYYDLEGETEHPAEFLTYVATI
jgi:2-polyprenyl-3-methyl-5-hydroxy-6-metoxy-1,4-benzoquinol methylase